MGKVWLLEVNAFPDFGQTGSEWANRVVGGFWEGVVGVLEGVWWEGRLKDGLGGEEGDGFGKGSGIEGGTYVGRGMWMVVDEDMGRG